MMGPSMGLGFQSLAANGASPASAGPVADNAVPYADFNNAYWPLSNATLIASSVADPNGGTRAVTLEASGASTNYHGYVLANPPDADHAVLAEDNLVSLRYRPISAHNHVVRLVSYAAALHIVEFTYNNAAGTWSGAVASGSPDAFGHVDLGGGWWNMWLRHHATSGLGAEFKYYWSMQALAGTLTGRQVSIFGPQIDQTPGRLVPGPFADGTLE